MPFLTVADTREFTSDYSLQLPTIYLFFSMENMFLSWAACPCDCTLHSGGSSQPSEYKLIVRLSEESCLFHDNLVCLILKPRCPRFMLPALEVNTEDAVVH